MAINFNIGDILVVKQSYVQNTLANTNFLVAQGIVRTNIKRAITLLGQFKHDPVEVLDTGSVDGTTDNGLPITWSYITIRPIDQSSPSYQSGSGIIIYWHDDTGINDTFELSSAFVVDSQSIRCLNSSGVTIFKGAIVYTTGFNAASNLPTVALAVATSSSTLAAFGIAEEEILTGTFGTVIIDGHYQGLDTSTFSINDIAYLSDTPGQISVVAGTGTSIVGRIINVGNTDGALAFRGIIPLGQGVGGGGPGAAGATGIQGPQGHTGLQGSGGSAGSQGVTGIEGNQGNTGIGLVGAQGLTGLMGLGTTGVAGVQGDQGNTGLIGVQGVQGVQGSSGSTGIQGSTGVFGTSGVTGLAGSQGVTGLVGSQGVTGIQGITGLGTGGDAVYIPVSVANDQTAFTLSPTPTNAAGVIMFINGGAYYPPAYFTVSGANVTWLNAFALISNDSVAFRYT
jgi:hypothetical protein